MFTRRIFPLSVLLLELHQSVLRLGSHWLGEDAKSLRVVKIQLLWEYRINKEFQSKFSDQAKTT